ncbi:hypothetical protein WA171_002079 [Blastocystis sp. BT1]
MNTNSEDQQPKNTAVGSSPATIEMQTIEKDTTVQVEKHPSAIDVIALGAKNLSQAGSVYGKGDKAPGSKSGSFYSEMDPTLLPTIIKKGSTMMEEESKSKPSTWGDVYFVASY